MQHRKLCWIAILPALVVAACVSRPTAQSTTRTTTSGGDVTPNRSDTLRDSAGGVCGGTTGALLIGCDRVAAIGLQARDVQSMSDGNIAAHVIAADSLAVAVSRVGALQAQDVLVRAFVERMIDEHGALRRLGEDMAFQGRVAPAPFPRDTTGLSLATLIMNRLTSESPGDGHDRLLMRAEVLLHRQILHDLELMQPRATGSMRKLVDETIPIVRRNLEDATFILGTVGGDMNPHEAAHGSSSHAHH